MPKIVDHNERREHIAKIVAELMSTVGVENTTIREISRQSGYSRGFIEHYFQDKEELVAAALNWINEQSLQRAQTKLQDSKGLAALRVLGEITLPISEESQKEWRVRLQYWGMAAVHPEHKKEQSRRMNVVEKMFLNHLREAQEMGEIPKKIDVAPLAQDLLHRMYGLSCVAILRPSHFTKQRQLEAIDYIFSEMLKSIGK